MNAPISLPSTLETFMEYQEQLIRRELSPAEKEATAAWLEIFNDVSAGEIAGNVALERVGFLISRTDNPALLRFLEAARAWILAAWEVAQ